MVPRSPRFFVDTHGPQASVISLASEYGATMEVHTKPRSGSPRGFAIMRTRFPRYTEEVRVSAMAFQHVSCCWAGQRAASVSIITYLV